MEGMLALADREEWAVSPFALADLGDKRRTQRLVKLAAMMGANSSGSIRACLGVPPGNAQAGNLRNPDRDLR